jgi:hypothetical protein
MNQPGAGHPPVDLGDSGHCDRAARLLASVDPQLRCVAQWVHQVAPLISTEELQQELVTLLLTAVCGCGDAAPALLTRAATELLVWALVEQELRELPPVDAGLPAPSAGEDWLSIHCVAGLPATPYGRPLQAAATTTRRSQ